MREEHGEDIPVTHQSFERALDASVLLEEVGGALLGGQSEEHQQFDCRTHAKEQEEEGMIEEGGTGGGGERGVNV